MNKPDVPFGLPLSVDQWVYFVCLAVCIVMFVLNGNEDTITVPVGPVMLIVGGTPPAAMADAAASNPLKIDIVNAFFMFFLSIGLNSERRGHLWKRVQLSYAHALLAAVGEGAILAGRRGPRRQW